MSSSTTATVANEESYPRPCELPQIPTVPRARYLDKSFYQLEMEHIFRKTWLLVGHACEFKKTGSYRLLNIPFAPVVVIRGKDSKLRALLNSCQHRGATVLRDKQGCAKVMSCQYHGWTYDLTGKLIGVTSNECFPELNKNDHSLPTLRCEQWGGFVYINFDNNAEPLLDFLAPLNRQHADAVAEYPKQPLRIVEKLSIDENCNWKAMVEAFWESYHVNYIHKTGSSQHDTELTVYKMFRNGHGGKFHQYRPKKEREKWEGSTTTTNLPNFPGVSDKYTKTFHTFGMFPTVLMTIEKTSMATIQIWPLAHNRCRVELVVYGVDWGDAPRPAIYDKIMAAAAVVIEEDMSNMCSIQASMEADPNKQNIFGGEEIMLYNFNAEIDRRIGVNNIPQHLRVTDALQDYVLD